MRTAPLLPRSCSCSARFRVALLLLVLVLVLGAPSFAAAQVAGATTATDEAELDQVDVEAAPAAKSGFGQVMAVLTGLLQDAAQREAGGGDDGFQLEDPALRIEVTPVAGSDSFLREEPRRARRTTGPARAAVAAQLAGEGAAQATPR